MRWLIPRWSNFQARHPEIDVHLVAGGGPFSFNSGIDLAIRRDDFPWPSGYHAEPLFAEKVGPVCRPDKVAAWFATKKLGARLKAGVPHLHTRTRPGAWPEWAAATGQSIPDASGQTFEHFYFSLQAAVAGLGVAIGPWHLVRDDLDSGVLAAPLGFIEDGSRYCLLRPSLYTQTAHRHICSRGCEQWPDSHLRSRKAAPRAMRQMPPAPSVNRPQSHHVEWRKV